MDICRDVKPMLVADIRHAPFKDSSVDVVVFDPPHIARPKYPPPWFNDPSYTFYGVKVKPSYIFDLIYRAGKEFLRILKPHGLLLLKWNEYMWPLSAVLNLLPDWTPVLKLPIRSPLQRGRATTIWTVFVRKSLVEPQGV